VTGRSSSGHYPVTAGDYPRSSPRSSPALRLPAHSSHGGHRRPQNAQEGPSGVVAGCGEGPEQDLDYTASEYDGGEKGWGWV